MKLILATMIIALAGCFALAQSTKLPVLLEPDAGSLNAGSAGGFEVFKLLPRGMFEADSYKDEDNPIGVRGGGAYYSFTNRVHSYNQVPQIQLQKGSLMVGFAGADYGFMRDLGPGSLAEISLESGIPAFLVNYRPPTLHDEVRKEKEKSHNYEAASGRFSRSVPALVGHVYALRAISFGDADVLVALHVMEAGNDGSLTIGWKRIKDFGIPKLQYQSDDSLRAKVEPVLNDARFRDVAASVAEDQVTLRGSAAGADIPSLLSSLRDKAGATTRIHNRLTPR